MRNVHVRFYAADHAVIATVAKKHLLSSILVSAEARQYLEDLIGGMCKLADPEDSQCRWLSSTTCLDSDEFVNNLKPFWEELLWGGLELKPTGHEHIIIFVHGTEQARSAAYELYLDYKAPEKPMIIKKHMSPGHWDRLQ